MAVDGFDRRVDVQNPRHAQERGVAFPQMTLLPAGHGRFVLGLAVAFGQAAAHRIFADHLAHTQQGRVDAIPA